MKVGAYLLEKHNFGDPEVKARFLDQFAYSDKILESILTDRYPVLLTCHIHDIAIFTGEDIDFLHSLEEYDKLSDFEKKTVMSPPMGKPFVTRPIIATINIKDIEDKIKVDMKNPPMAVKIPLNDGTSIEMVSVDEAGILRYEEAMAKLRTSMDYPSFISSSEFDPELDALYQRIKERTKGINFKVITPRAIELGDQPKSDPGEVDYLVTTYPISGIESVQIVKGRELGIGVDDKYVFGNQMKSTVGKLPPQPVDTSLDDSKPQEMIPVPKDLLRELANIAMDNGYPCADTIFEILSKNK